MHDLYVCLWGFAAARESGRVVVFLEPIALYMTKDLHEPKDGGWLFDYPVPTRSVPLGAPRLYAPDAADLLIVTYGNGCYLSHQAQAFLEKQKIKTRIVDLRWLAPMPQEAILNAVKGCKHVLVVDECRRTGSQSEGICAFLAEAGVPSFARLTAEDSFIATGPAYGATLPSRDGIVQAVRNLIDNCLKYTPAGGTVTITSTRTADDVRVDFINDGPGIPAAELPYVFERFFRAEYSRSRDVGGAGSA